MLEITFSIFSDSFRQHILQININYKLGKKCRYLKFKFKFNINERNMLQEFIFSSFLRKKKKKPYWTKAVAEPVSFIILPILQPLSSCI